MSVNCNKIIPFEPDVLETKAALGHSVSAALHAAFGQCYKAVEIIESSPAPTGAEVVYLRASSSKLDAAMNGLRGMRAILVGGQLPDEGIAWLKALDYDRLFSVGSEKGQIPSFREPWDRLVALMEQPDNLSVTDRLIADVESCQQDINAVVDIMASGRPLSDAGRIAKMQSALVQLAAFAQMVSYLNNIEPMDSQWIRTGSAVKSPDSPQLTRQ